MQRRRSKRRQVQLPMETFSASNRQHGNDSLQYCVMDLEFTKLVDLKHSQHKNIKRNHERKW